MGDMSGAAEERGIWRARFAVPVLLALTLVGFFWGIASLPLMDPEEPRCALIVREMIDSGNWTQMRLHDEAYYDKPAPYFWLTAFATRLTGSAELGGRGVSALCGIAAVFLAYFMARRVFGARAALFAGVMLATCGEFAFIARWYRMEMPTALCMWGALACFWCMEDEFQKTGVMRRAWWYGFYACGALATLFKGPVGIGLPGLVVVVYLLLSGRPKRVFEPLHVKGIVLFFALAAPWYILMCARDSNYAYEFFVKQNLTRYGGKAKDEIFYVTYLPVLIAGAAPWSMWLLVSLVKMWPRSWKARMQQPGLLFLWAMLLVPFVFFQLSGTKLIHYILPVFLPAAVLMGGMAERFLAAERTKAWESVGLVAACFLMIAGPLALSILSHDIDLALLVPISLGILGGDAVCVLLGSGRRVQALAVTCGMAALMYFFIIADDALHVYDDRCAKALGVLVPAEDRMTARFIAYEKNSLSFEYYAKVRAERIIESDNVSLIKAFDSTGRIYALLDDDEDLALVKKALGDRVYLIGTHRNSYLVSNRPPRK